MKTGINLGFGFPQLSMEDQLRYIRESGFDAVFGRWTAPGDACRIARAIRDTGLIVHSIHAPPMGARYIWRDIPEGAAAFEELKACLRDCHEAGVELMVCHTFQSFDPEIPTELGVNRFRALLNEAQSYGIRIAFENLEGEQYLSTLRDHLWDHPAAGFCFDSGHAWCYNAGMDVLSKYGSRLIATHINDNEGITGTTLDTKDDAHLMPFDGVVDWEYVTRGIAATGFDGILMLELKNRNMPGRHTHDIYAHLDCAGFLRLAYEKALKVICMIEAARR